jgi:hypothetical protein
MKALAQLRIKDADPRIKQVPSEELDEKIDLIYSLGYVYNPYDQEFYNPFINKGLKAIVTYNLNLDRIENLHKNLEKEFLGQNLRVKTFDEISDSIYGNDKVSRIGIFLESMAGIIGVFFLLLSIILHISNNINFALGCLIASFIFINFYLIQNLLFGINEGEWQLSPFWIKYKNFFSILSLLQYPYIYYLLLVVLDSYWLPILIIFPIKWLVKRFVTRKLSRKFWQMTGINNIREYAEQKGFL